MDIVDEMAVLRDFASYVCGEYSRYIRANKPKEDMSDPLFKNDHIACRILQHEVYMCETMDDIERLKKQLHQLHDYFITNYGDNGE